MSTSPGLITSDVFLERTESAYKKPTNGLPLDSSSPKMTAYMCSNNYLNVHNMLY